MSQRSVTYPDQLPPKEPSPNPGPPEFTTASPEEHSSSSARSADAGPSSDSEQSQPSRPNPGDARFREEVKNNIRHLLELSLKVSRVPAGGNATVERQNLALAAKMVDLQARLLSWSNPISIFPSLRNAPNYVKEAWHILSDYFVRY